MCLLKTFLKTSARFKHRIKEILLFWGRTDFFFQILFQTFYKKRSRTLAGGRAGLPEHAVRAAYPHDDGVRECRTMVPILQVHM